MVEVRQISRYVSRSLLKGPWQTGPKFCVQDSTQDKWSFLSVIIAWYPCAVPDTTMIAQSQIPSLQRWTPVSLWSLLLFLQEKEVSSDATRSTTKALLGTATGSSQAQQLQHCNEKRWSPWPMHTLVCPHPTSPQELIPAQQSKFWTLLQAMFYLLRDMLKGDLVPLTGICNLNFI